MASTDTPRNAAPRLSAIIITRNEAANIAECLDSVAFCDERIVVDCGSSDGTLLIAREKGARVAFHDWKGFGAQKNYALSLAQGEWVLSIDADERVTPALAQAIRAAIDGDADGYEILRLTSILRSGDELRAWNSRLCVPAVSARAGTLLRRPGARTDHLDGKIAPHPRAAAASLGAQARGCAAPHRRLFDAQRRSRSRPLAGPSGSSPGSHAAACAFLRAYVLQLGFLDGATASCMPSRTPREPIIAT